jgi:type IV secretory pathway TraG/TraD family ATPase VirD4
MLSWFKGKKARGTRFHWPLEMQLGAFNAADYWRLVDAVTGTIVLGSTGSGKSSGAARFFLRNMLRHGLGGLVLCVKAEDRLVVEQYARECGREGDIVVLEPSGQACCNVLAYELGQGREAAMRVENAVELFRTALEIAERDQRSSNSSGDNKYFERACLQALRSALLVLVVAGEPVTLENIHRFMITAPRSLEEARDPLWRGRSYCYTTLCKADDQALSGSLQKDFELSLLYWMEEYAGMDAKPRASILSTYTTMADVFQRGVIRECFFDGTAVTPDACREGKILILDFPTLRWNATGRIVQAVFKHVWQRAMERGSGSDNLRPVFLFSDEAQQFLISTDAAFQATARSSKVCTVYLTQNLPGMYEAVGGEPGRHVIDSLLGNLRLKVFHAQEEVSTCQYQSELLGQTRRFLFNGNTNGDAHEHFDFFNPGKNHSTGMSESWEYEIQPWEWSHRLRSGGPENDFLVDGIVYQGGRIWNASGRSYLPVTFHQKAR